MVCPRSAPQRWRRQRGELFLLSFLAPRNGLIQLLALAECVLKTKHENGREALTGKLLVPHLRCSYRVLAQPQPEHRARHEECEPALIGTEASKLEPGRRSLEIHKSAAGCAPMPSESRRPGSVLRKRVRALLDKGGLPLMVSEQIVGGYGAGHVCVACDQPITKTQVEYETADHRDGKRLYFHLDCHAVWQLECAQARAELHT